MFNRRDPGRDFISNHLTDIGLRTYFGQPKFEAFCEGIGSKAEVVAAKQYNEVTGASLAECRLAWQLAKTLLT